MSTMTYKKEGFWHSVKGDDLPKPKARENPWKGRKVFLKALCRLEYLLIPTYMKGYSSCRICKCKNGSGTYFYKGWKWPTGFYHYVKEHNVKPSKAFIRFVIKEKK